MTIRTVPNPTVDPTYHDAFLEDQYIGAFWFNPQMYIWFYQFGAGEYRSAQSRQAAIEGLVEWYKEWKGNG